jgi:hypothetical protein
MRYIIMLIAAFCLLGTPSASNAQVNVNVNLGIQPVWGPVGYDYVENYYFPDLDIYYNVPQHVYYYYKNGIWVSRRHLPHHFRSYDIFTLYKIVINEPNPWMRHSIYRDKYSSYRGRHDQQFIRDSHDERYFVIKDHPEHQKWVKNHGGNPHEGNNNGQNVRHFEPNKNPANNQNQNNGKPRTSSQRTFTKPQTEPNIGKGMNKNNGAKAQPAPAMRNSVKSQPSPVMKNPIKTQRGPDVQRQGNGRGNGGPGMQKQGNGRGNGGPGMQKQENGKGNGEGGGKGRK